MEYCLASACFWPSANCLAWHEGGPNGVRVCVKLAGAMQSIFRSYGGSFQSAWQLGKVLGRKSQIVVI